MSDPRQCHPDDPCLPCRADSDMYANPASDDRVALERIARDLLMRTDFHNQAAVMFCLVDAVLDAGWRPPARVITTAAELDALPDRSIIQMHSGSTLRTNFDTVAQKSDDVWEVPNEVGQFTSDALDLPALLLWQPEVNGDV